MRSLCSKSVIGTLNVLDIYIRYINIFHFYVFYYLYMFTCERMFEGWLPLQAQKQPAHETQPLPVVSVGCPNE